MRRIHITHGAPGWDRTSDHRFRRPVLYPLSYGRLWKCTKYARIDFGKAKKCCSGLQSPLRSAKTRGLDPNPTVCVESAPP